MRLALVVPLVVACSSGPTCDLTGLAEGAVRGTVDGVGWDTTGAAWSPTGGGIQIVTASGGGYRVTFSLQESVEGQAMGAAVAEAELPIEVSFDDDVTAFALLYADGESGSFTTTGNTGGGITIEAIDGQVLGACFDFVASNAHRNAAVEGALRAPPL